MNLTQQKHKSTSTGRLQTMTGKALLTSLFGAGDELEYVGPHAAQMS
jgi:hypothetical protein